MAELEIRQPESNIYSNVEDCEALPLFVRYTSDDAKFMTKMRRSLLKTLLRNCRVPMCATLFTVVKRDEIRYMKNSQ